jgi:hypothetical protein
MNTSAMLTGVDTHCFLQSKGVQGSGGILPTSVQPTFSVLDGLILDIWGGGRGLMNFFADWHPFWCCIIGIPLPAKLELWRS